MRRSGFSYLINSISIVMFLGLVMGSADFLYAQSFDHDEYPKLDFSFNSLELDLGIQPQNLRIDGGAKYEVEANVSGADTLILYASHIDIKSVAVDEETADFFLSNDSLYVPMDDSSEAGQRYELTIRYSGRPQFGLLKNSNNTVWTSQLPKSERHWVPIVDNPHVSLNTTFNISVPSGLQVWATGKKTGEEAVSVDVMRYHFKSEKEVPASSIAFGVGKFDNQSTSFGIKRINLAMEQSLTDTVNGQQLLQKAYDYLEAIENHLQFEYPYERLNLLVVEDHGWETKSWGASTVFLYNNRGNLETQLLRGIIAQWFGIYQRESQWSQADAITLYQTLISTEIGREPAKLMSENEPNRSFSTIYDNFGSERWNKWLAGIPNWQSSSVRTLVSGFASNVLKELPEVITWRDYADFWYREIGQPVFDMPYLSMEEGSISKQPLDSVAYKVTYTFNEVSGELKLRFESTYGSYSELTTLKAYEVYPNETDTSEVTFTGKQDSVMLQVDPLIQTLRLETLDHPELVLDQYKPARFLINEFQSSETVDQRAEAARKLGYHRNNPDLQLAIRDFMNKELDPKVKAALLRSMGDITNGAAGTEQEFLDALQNDNPAIRDAGLMALQNYKGNSSIIKRVESVAQNANEFGLFKKATQVLTSISSQEQFGNFVTEITQQDSLGERSVFAIQELANMGSVEEAVKRAGLFTGDQYRYEIRKRALEILIQHDHSPADWLIRSEELLGDADPRIRFLTMEGLERNQNDEINAFLSERIHDEYDARVYYKMQQVVNGE